MPPKARARVLDAALQLFLRFGYDKTTMGEIAREAGISKGAVYLVFDSKDALFETLLLFQMREFSRAWFSRVQAHPQAGTIGSMYESMLLAFDDVPLMSFIFRRDPTLLGRYLQRPNNLFRKYAAGQPTRHEAIQMLQAVGAVRDDIDPKVVAHVMNMLAHGLVTMDQVVPAEQIPPTDEVIRGIAIIMDRALTPADGGNREAGMQLLRQLFEGGEAAMAKMLEEEDA